MIEYLENQEEMRRVLVVSEGMAPLKTSAIKVIICVKIQLTQIFVVLN